MSQPDRPVSSNKNTGHGHVFPRPDGMKARCGGPAMCSDCAKDLARKYASEVEASVPLSTYESAVKGQQDFRKAYIEARRLLKKFVDAWEGVPGHENMDRLCEIARGFSADSSAPETKKDEPPYFVRSYWSPNRKYLITVHAMPDGIISVQDDNGREWEPAGEQQNMASAQETKAEPTGLCSAHREPTDPNCPTCFPQNGKA